MKMIFHDKNGPDLPYVHSEAGHFGTTEDKGSKNLLLQKKFSIDDIKNIKTRYLQMMDIQNQTNLKIIDDTTKEQYISGMEKLEHLSNLEFNLQEQIAQAYNKSAQNIDFQRYANDLKKFVSDIQTNQITQNVDQFFSIFTDPINQKAARQLLDLSKNPNKVSLADIRSILDIDKLNKLVNDKKGQNSSTFYTIWNDINSLMQMATEALAAYAARGWPEGVTWEEIKKCVVGAHSQAIQVSFGNEKKSVLSKRADIKLPGEGITINISALENNSELKGTVTVIPKFNFATVKSYISNRNIKLTSYSQSNSWLITALRDFYEEQYKGDKSGNLDYILYNTLVFQNKGNEIIKNNFKIIKQDLTLGYAEKFLVGFNAEEAQRLFIYRLQAIPIINIITKIIEDATTQLEKDRFFGTNGRHFFYVNIDKIQATIDNKIENNIRDRLERVKNEVNNLKITGQMNSRALRELVAAFIDKNKNS